MSRILLVLALVVAGPVGAEQKVTAESVGFRTVAVPTVDGTQNVYISSGGQPLNKTSIRPLVIYLQGSGYMPIVRGQAGRLSSTFILGPRDFPKHHYAIVGKPGAPFWAPGNLESPKEYHETYTLDNRIAVVSAVVDFLNSPTRTGIKATNCLISKRMSQRSRRSISRPDMKLFCCGPLFFRIYIATLPVRLMSVSGTCRAI